jgi:hypothetical protein
LPPPIEEKKIIKPERVASPTPPLLEEKVAEFSPVKSDKKSDKLQQSFELSEHNLSQGEIEESKIKPKINQYCLPFSFESF